MSEFQISLPNQVAKAKNVNASSMILYGVPKSGKTTAVSQLPNCLIVDVEDGSGFVDGMIVQPPKNAGPVKKFKWLKSLAEQIREADHPYDYVVIDTISQLDMDAEWVGTYNYMQTSQGKKFNRDEDGKALKATDSNYESVLTLANGYGYRYTREAILDIFETLKGLGRICTIFICHVSDKMVSKGNSEEVLIKDLALIGKTRDILPRIVDAVGNVWNEDGKFMVSFVGSEHKVGGIRAKHLVGFEGELDWSKIFINE